MLDVVIVGGGPAGLSAALMLGRCRRRVLVCDGGRPRNEAAQALHGYLSRDGVPPHELLRLGREELQAYDVELRSITVAGLQRVNDGFEVSLESGDRVRARIALLATGVRDHLPDIPGVAECFGITVHHCPYCDGWEVRDKKLAVIGQGTPAAGLALALKTWSRHVMVCPNGSARLAGRQRRQLADHDIEVVEGPVTRLDHDAGYARQLLVSGDRAVACDAVFLATGQAPQSDFPRQMGCALTRAGTVKTDHLGQTSVAGLYVVGDASRDVQFVIVAAAEGAKAAVAINKALQASDGLEAVKVPA